jgi:alpha-methylacyl-CoA racemase
MSGSSFENSKGPLAGVRVVEVAGIGPAPFCAMVLADLGAEVVRLDRASAGPSGGGVDALTDGIMGRGRRSVAVDLKHPDGLAVALALLDSADALVEGFRPGVMERLGLGPDVVLGRNPALVYGRLTGWGQDGPLAQAVGHDLNYIAVAGALAPLGRAGAPPAPPLNVLGDFAGGGLVLALGIAAALVDARRSGVGQVVDAAMVDGAAYLMTMMYELLGRGGWTEARQSNANDGGAHFYDVYACADGRFVSVAAMEPRFYAALTERLGLDDLPDQWDPSTWPASSARLAEVFATRTRDEWAALFEGTDACVAPVLEMSEAPSHPHLAARGTFAAVGGVVQPAPAPRFSRTPTTAGAPAAAVGEHTGEVLRALGYADDRIAALRAAGAVR